MFNSVSTQTITNVYYTSFMLQHDCTWHFIICASVCECLSLSLSVVIFELVQEKFFEPGLKFKSSTSILQSALLPLVRSRLFGNNDAIRFYFHDNVCDTDGNVENIEVFLMMLDGDVADSRG